MKLISKINGLLAAQKNATTITEWRFCTASKANVFVGELKAAELWALHIVPTQQQVEISGTTYKERGTFDVYYLTDQEVLDVDAASNISKQDRCLAAALDLLKRLQSDTEVQVSNTQVSATLMYSVNDRTCTGVKTTFTLAAKAMSCLEEVPSTVSVSATLSNATANSLNVSLVYAVGTKVVASKGFYWGLNDTPTTKVVMTGDTYTLTNLEPNVTYFIKPYIVTTAETVGEVVSIKTQVSSNETLKLFGNDNYIVNGIIIPDTDTYGLCYATHTTPTTADSTTSVLLENNMFTKNVESLITTNTYFRIYRTSSGVTHYSNEVSIAPIYYQQLRYVKNKYNAAVIMPLQVTNGWRLKMYDFMVEARQSNVGIFIAIEDVSEANNPSTVYIWDYVCTGKVNGVGGAYITNWSLNSYYDVEINAIAGEACFSIGANKYTYPTTIGSTKTTNVMVCAGFRTGDAPITTAVARFGNFEFEYNGGDKYYFVPCKLVYNTPADKCWDNQQHLAGEVGFWCTTDDKFYGNGIASRTAGYFEAGPEI